MIAPTRPSATPSLLEAEPKELALAAFNQNFETFRTLNSLMWQIPLIAMTLTGGLWFGVSKVEEASAFRLGLLALAFFGNVGLIVVLERLRFIIGRYLEWMDDAYPRGHVSAIGTGRFRRGETVKLVFQVLLGFAAIVSLVLIVTTMATMARSAPAFPPAPAAAWYDEHAERLADGYEGLDAAVVHQPLFELLEGSSRRRILDVGSGTGRDAAALAALGHEVVAVEPSTRMMRLARGLHADAAVTWSVDALPGLPRQTGPFDFVVLSAVWMHVPPSERAAAFHRLTQLAGLKGRIYMTLRIGPADPARGMFAVDVEEVRRLAKKDRRKVVGLAEQPDLLGREEVSWRIVMVDPVSVAHSSPAV